MRVSPAEVRFVAESAGVTLSRLIQIRRSDGKDVRISRAEPEDDSFRVTWPEGAYPVNTIRVKWTPGERSGTGESKIRLELAEPEGTALEIPVYWRTP